MQRDLDPLVVDGDEKVSFDFGESLTDGQIGVGTDNAIARFDDVNVAEPAGPVPPLYE